MIEEQVFQNMVSLSNALAIATNNRILSPEQAGYILRKYLRENNLLPVQNTIPNKEKIEKKGGDK